MIRDEMFNSGGERGGTKRAFALNGALKGVSAVVVKVPGFWGVQVGVLRSSRE